MKKIILLFSFITCISGAGAQTFEQWYGGSQSDDGRGIIQLPDSGFAILARSWSWTNGGSDLVLLRTDKYGDTLWTKLYGGAYNEFTSGAIKMTPDNGFVIAGNTLSYGPGTPTYFNWYLVKTDANGDTLWTKTWGTATNNDELRHVLPTSDGNYLLCGGWIVSGVTKGVLLKIDAAGNTLWGDTLPSGATSHFMYACEKVPNEYVVTGYALAGDFNAVVRKYDAAGNMQINKSYDYGEPEAGITIEPVPGSGYICSGTHGFMTSVEPWIIRLDDNLDTMFTRVMDFNYTIAGISAKEYSIYPSGNGFIICGSYINKLMIRKTDALLNTEWEQLYGATMGESGYEGIQTSDGGFAAVGITYSFGAGSADIYLVKTDSLGNVQATAGIKHFQTTTPAAYPNPFSDYIIVSQHDFNSRVTISDLTGKRYKELTLNKEQTRINLSELKKSAYILTSENESGIHREIIIKY